MYSIMADKKINLVANHTEICIDLKSQALEKIEGIENKKKKEKFRNSAEKIFGQGKKCREIFDNKNIDNFGTLTKGYALLEKIRDYEEKFEPNNLLPEKDLLPEEDLKQSPRAEELEGQNKTPLSEGGKRRTRKRGKKARRSKKNNKKRKGKKSKRTRKHK